TSRSIHGKAFSWPIATSTSSHGMCVCGSPVGTRLRRPFSSYSALTFSNETPVSLPPSWMNSTGTRKLRIGMPSCIASSFSQTEAFISSKPLRTTTVTCSPPSRREERQQSIAVLPPPSTMTRRPILSIWPNEIACDGQRGRAGADQRDALAVLLLRDGRQISANVALVVGGDPLQPADRHRLGFDPAAAAGRFARPVAGAAEDAGKDIRLPVDSPGFAIALLGDQPDVFRHRRVCRTGPLAIDDLVEIV